jgi:nitrogen-specific signal transduction histidine kinase
MGQWKVSESDKTNVRCITEHNGNKYDFSMAECWDKKTATRIVECVNALSGIESPAEFVAKAKHDAEELEALRKEVERLNNLFKRLTKIAPQLQILIERLQNE